MKTNAWNRLTRSLAVLGTVGWLAAGCAQPPATGTTTSLAISQSTPIREPSRRQSDCSGP